ncbi:hypothetical protein [Cytobacillus oceanisediminis]|uniref:Cysteine-rich KTR protein n=1 Tax=Cytobacillus oceanisediminis TaxID=665099 RepID=A0ABX3CJT1_9BACI|nr:hypothetical protein [Cytobacillus oceanisediminis]OHX38844.1 hypothetical protein BBV17_04875 [Cytobacillus oceanisediminis]
MAEKKTSYLLFCSKCGVPRPIPPYIMETYFIKGVDGVYCCNYGNRSIIPGYLKKIKNDL